MMLGTMRLVVLRARALAERTLAKYTLLAEAAARTGG